MKTLAIEEAKYLDDVQLITKKLMHTQNQRFREIGAQNKQMLDGIEGIVYLEKN